MDKCDSHDTCFKRLYERLENMDDKLDRFFNELRDRLHNGDLRFERLEMRIELCEKTLSDRSSGRTDVKRKAVGGLIDLLKIAITALVGAAAWAVANGYGG